VDTSELDPFFTAKMKAAGAPGLAVSVIGDGKIKWMKGYGLANIEENRPVTQDTVFMLASVSKSVTAVALMSLIEDPSRGLSLDQDVDDKLPFTVRNPSFPDTPITFRMLLTHTSSLIDSDAYWAFSEPATLHQGDSPIPLLDFDRDYVSQDDSWSSDEPGTAFSYSNTGASLLGLLVEQITGKNLQSYAKAAIFDKIGMPETSFFLRDLDPSHIAMPYKGSNASTFAPLGQYGYPDYPDGQLRTSAAQLSRFLLMLAGNGACGQRVLAEETVKDMEQPQVPDIQSGQGLILFSQDVGGTTVIGHNGADQGVSTEMFLDPASGSGYVILTNGSANLRDSTSQSNAMDAMSAKLLDLAKTLP
jgi:CubicO group peptidase (beta-lactamase class C family)